MPAGGSLDPEDALLEKIGELAKAGVDWIQIREKDLLGRRLASLARRALRRVAENASHMESTVWVLVNERLDVAVAEHLGGVHLGERSLSAREAKRFLQECSQEMKPLKDFLVGVSCHSLTEAESAAESGADYLFFGPVFSTPSKAAFGEPQGLDRLAVVCHAVSIPVLAIGGITEGNVRECLDAGASGIAAIRMFQDAREPVKLAKLLHSLHC